jgi:hypothetical protein
MTSLALDAEHAGTTQASLEQSLVDEPREAKSWGRVDTRDRLPSKWSEGRKEPEDVAAVVEARVFSIVVGAASGHEYESISGDLIFPCDIAHVEWMEECRKRDGGRSR